MLVFNYHNKEAVIYKGVKELTSDQRANIKTDLSLVQVGDLFLTADGYVVNILDIYYKKIGKVYKKFIVIPGKHIVYKRNKMVRLRSNVLRKIDYMFIVLVSNGVDVKLASKQVYGGANKYIKRINSGMLNVLSRRLKMDIKKSLADELRNAGIDEAIIAKEIAEAIKGKNGNLKKWAIEMYLNLMEDNNKTEKSSNVLQNIKLDYKSDLSITN